MSGILVRVLTSVKVLGQPLPAYWVVATDSPEEALRKVREKVPNDWGVELTGGKIAPDVVESLSLTHGEAHHL